MSLDDDFGLKRKPRRIAEINLINMIDMLFFLIVFFVLTSSFTSDPGGMAQLGPGLGAGV